MSRTVKFEKRTELDKNDLTTESYTYFTTDNGFVVEGSVFTERDKAEIFFHRYVEIKGERSFTEEIYSVEIE